MTRTGRLTRDGTHGPARKALRAHVAAYVFVVIICTGLFTAGLLGAPLVSVLLIGILLVCPLLMWVPFRFEQKTRDQVTSRTGTGSGDSRVVVLASAQGARPMCPRRRSSRLSRHTWSHP